ncbi:MAG: tagaturonate reductase [Lentisphaerae bacterium]|nr:tagaturonate reductase [Lentisphaerota bacterium]
MKKNKIMQFGEGVFLRGFIEPLIQQMNQQSSFNGEVYAVKPRAGAVPQKFADQHCQYNLLVRGIAEDNSAIEKTEKITCLKQVYSSSEDWQKIEALACDPDLTFIFSNTTEAGIAYEVNNLDTFPGKLARLLKKRFESGQPGVTVLPCELIENNGQTLKEYVLRYLQDDPAAEYVKNACSFYDTLVDRIVSGFPADFARFDANDQLMVAVEPFAFLAIKAPAKLSEILPLPEDVVVFTDDLTPYRMRKVRALNASHTCMVSGGLLAGFSEVQELLQDDGFRKRIETTLFDEILPTVKLPEAEKRLFAESVLRRFANPFAHHKLEAIALNSAAKWKVRILPVIQDSKVLPYYLSRSLGELFKRYKLSGAAGDTAEVAARFCGSYSIDDFLADRDLWDMDLHSIPGLAEAAKEAGL